MPEYNKDLIKAAWIISFGMIFSMLIYTIGGTNNNSDHRYDLVANGHIKIDHKTGRVWLLRPEGQNDVWKSINEQGKGSYRGFNMPNPIIGHRTDSTAEQKLYTALHNAQYYTKSYKAFKKRFATPKSQEALYNALHLAEYYTKPLADFRSIFFPDSLRIKDISQLPAMPDSLRNSP